MFFAKQHEAENHCYLRNLSHASPDMFPNSIIQIPKQNDLISVKNTEKHLSLIGIERKYAWLGWADGWRIYRDDSDKTLLKALRNHKFWFTERKLLQVFFQRCFNDKTYIMFPRFISVPPLPKEIITKCCLSELTTISKMCLRKTSNIHVYRESSRANKAVLLSGLSVNLLSSRVHTFKHALFMSTEMENRFECLHFPAVTAILHFTLLLMNERSCPVGWGYWIHRLLLCIGVRPHPKSAMDMILNDQMMRIQ